MRTRIVVAELSPGQWDWLRRNLPKPRDFATDAIRMCVVFELEPGVEQHLELNPREFVGLMTRLHVVTRTVEAALVETTGPISCDQPGLPRLPTAEQVRNLSADGAADLARRLSEPCKHGSQVVLRDESVFEGAPPVLTYEDGCQSYGPYRSPDA